MRRTGETVGDYVLEQPIGSGRCGDVYQAYDARLDRRVAIKLIRSDGPALTARILGDLRAAAEIVHPNVVTTYDVGEIDGAPYVVTELLAGTSLRALIDAGDAPFDERIRWLREILSGLEAIHARGLVHRNVKPENVFVTADGAVKLVDCGVAGAMAWVDRGAETRTLDPARAEAGNEEARAEVTRVAGTVAYLAPEQLRGETVDARADQFAWGVVACEVLTGRRPWEATSDSILVARMIDSGPTHPPADGEVRALLDHVIGPTLALQPKDRLSSVASVLHRLQAPKYSIGTSGPRHEGRVSNAIFVSCAGILLATALHSRGNPEGTNSTIRETPEQPTSTNPTAAAAFREGMQAYRDASGDAAWLAFRRAAQLDPTFAAARLQQYLLINIGRVLDESENQYFQEAYRYRSTLSERDRSLLHTIAPWYSVPRDADETDARFLTLRLTWPTDGELAYWHSVFRSLLSDDKGALKAVRQAYALGFDIPMAHAVEGGAFEGLGDENEARRSFTACATGSPAPALCWRTRAFLNMMTGQCAEAEADARRLIAVDSSNVQGYVFLSNVLANRKDDEASALAFTRLNALREDAGNKADSEWLFEVRRGDFARAEIAQRDSSSMDYPDKLLWRILLADEEGFAARANDAAREYISLSAGWITPDGEDPAIDGWCALRFEGAISTSEWNYRRNKWRASLPSKTGDPNILEFNRWYRSDVCAARTEADGRAALASRPSEEVERNGFNHANDGVRAEIGRIHRLAGDIEGAINFLTQVVDSCWSLKYAAAKTHAAHDLSLALAAKGDTSAACAADQRVITQWGHARPRSITADAARAHMRKLHCPANTVDPSVSTTTTTK